MPSHERKMVRNKTKKLILESFCPTTEHRTINNTVKSLAKKDCHYIKADKGNSVVILDKNTYDERMMKALQDKNLQEVKNPLPSMIRVTKNVLNIYKHILSLQQRMKLTESNPQVPSLYGLPKIHKSGDAMRLISSNIKSPTHEISKFCVEQFKKLIQPESLSVKNNKEFIEKVKNFELEPDDLLISFDVTALYPNVPLNESLEFFDDWINQQDLSEEEKRMLSDFTDLSMKLYYFSFRGKFFR